VSGAAEIAAGATTALAHISDVHFGREDPALVRGLLQALFDCNPDLIVVSGDLTQRARIAQFRAAEAFLHQLPPVPRLVIPGNHDISATNLLQRALLPLDRYKRMITNNMAPFIHVASRAGAPGVAVAGINTVRVISRKDGRINAGQVRLACGQLSRSTPGTIRVVATHHPLDLPAGNTLDKLTARAPMAIAGFARCGVDLFLSGHLHEGLAMTTSTRYPGLPHSAVVVHAGTAVSTRTRAQPNGWNLLHLGNTSMAVNLMRWTGTRFDCVRTTRFSRVESGWVCAD
jgi:3',5'-cyclic AMP phosphodiesterase CpdA